MKEIVNRLHENRQVELAKSILETAGYTVVKESEDKETIHILKDKMISIRELLDNYGGVEVFSAERGGTDELDIPCQMLGGNYTNVYTITDQDEEGPAVLEIIRSLDDKKELSREDISGVGYCILMDSSLGRYVYQNQSGMEVIYIKF